MICILLLIFGIEILANGVLFLFVSEIAKVRSSLFQVNGMKKEPLILPEAQGTTATLTEKVFVPVKEHPDVSTEDFILKF